MHEKHQAAARAVKFHGKMMFGGTLPLCGEGPRTKYLRGLLGLFGDLAKKHWRYSRSCTVVESFDLYSVFSYRHTIET